MMRVSSKGLLASVVAVVVGSSLLLAAPGAQAATVSPAASVAPAGSTVAEAAGLTAPVTGSFTDSTGGAGIFTGTFAPTEFTATDTDVIATGTLTGTLTDAAGTDLGTVTQTISTPLDREASSGSSTLAAASCQILDLRLQPLDLNLLGLTVHLDTVHLNITAVTGPGNLLGNLLCAVTGLLDGAGALAQIAALLNQILALLNGLGG
jgi:hypothetical protein